MKKFIAFTLAETLIVMGIVGVVAALTLPNLNSSTGDKEKVARVKKIYQNLSDAYGRAVAIYGPYDEWFLSDGTDTVKKAKRAGERITEFMKLSKTCGTGSTAGCFSSATVKQLTGTNSGADGFDGNNNNYYKVVTADGTSLSFQDNYSVVVDIDGPTKGSTTMGKDLFKFVVNNVGVTPYDYSQNNFTGYAQHSMTGYASTAWIINYDNADYMQIASVADGKATCTNRNVMTESHPSCK